MTTLNGITTSNSPVCFVAGTPVMTGEQIELVEEAVAEAPADIAFKELLLPAAAVAIGAAGYWVGERRSAKRKREEELVSEAAHARAFADWDKGDGIL